MTDKVEPKNVDDHGQYDEQDDANPQTGKAPYANEPELQSTEESQVPHVSPVYPATIEEATQFCMTGATNDFPQQIFMDDPKDKAKSISIINCAQLFAAQGKKPKP